MSYDLMVFDPTVAPRSRPAFEEWYETITAWPEGRDYNSPEGISEGLMRFYKILREEFPPMNGPDAMMAITKIKEKSGFKRFLRTIGVLGPAPQIDDHMIADYSFAEHAIYIAFAWRVEKLAYNRVVNVALDTKVGFFDVGERNGRVLYDADDFYALMGL